MNNVNVELFNFNNCIETIQINSRQFIDKLSFLKFPELKSIIFNWKDHIITHIDDTEKKLDWLIPNFKIQSRYDEICHLIQKETTHLNKFNHWLYDNGYGDWHEQLAVYLAKLPLRVACNIVRLLFSYIKIALGAPSYIIMHPLKVPLKLAKILIELIHALLQPETWTKLGAGLMGSSLGSAVLGGPLGLMTLGIGAAMVIGGISCGTLKTMLIAEKEKKWRETQSYLHNQIKQFPDDLATGFFLIMVLEGINKAMRGVQVLKRELKYAFHKSKVKEAYFKNQLKIFYESNPLPRHERFTYRNNDFSISWHHETFKRFRLLRNFPGAEFFKESVHTRDYVFYDHVYNSVTQKYEEVMRTIPIYEDFFGYRISVPDFIPPIKPPLAQPIRLINDDLAPKVGAVVVARDSDNLLNVKSKPKSVLNKSCISRKIVYKKKIR